MPREELPAHLQPQNSIRGKIINYINGIDPRLPQGAKTTTQVEAKTVANARVKSNQKVSAPETDDVEMAQVH